MDLTEKEKNKLSKMFPNLKRFKNRQERERKISKYRIRLIDVTRQEFLEKLPQRLEGYLNQINQQFKIIKSNDDSVKSLNDKVDRIVNMLEEKEQQRRKVAGKVGGLTASLNKEKEKSEKLLENKVNLENTIEVKNKEIKLKELELKEKDIEIKILKNLGKKKQMSDYKKLQEIRKDIDNHKKIRGVKYDESV